MALAGRALIINIKREVQYKTSIQLDQRIYKAPNIMHKEH